MKLTAAVLTWLAGLYLPDHLTRDGSPLLVVLALTAWISFVPCCMVRAGAVTTHPLGPSGAHPIERAEPPIAITPLT